MHTGNSRSHSRVSVVLYQSCYRELYVRHVALRSLCVLFFLYSLVVSVFCALGPYVFEIMVPLTVVGAAVDVVGVVLSSVLLWYRVRHEKARVRDDIARAGEGGDVEAQIERLRALSAARSVSPVHAAAALGLLMLKFGKLEYLCVEPCRSDGNVPTTAECLEAAERETRRRRRDDAAGKANFAMAVIGTCFNVTLSVLVLLLVEDYGILMLSASGVMMPLFVVAAAVLFANCFFIGIRGCAGINISPHSLVVPAGLMSVEIAGDETIVVGTAARVVYQEALPGPPLEELEMSESELHLQKRQATRDAAGVWPPHHTSSPLPPHDDGDQKVSKGGKVQQDIWVWGGFAHGDERQPTTTAPLPSADALPATPSKPEPRFATRSPPRATAPLSPGGSSGHSLTGEQDISHSSCLQGHL